MRRLVSCRVGRSPRPGIAGLRAARAAAVSPALRRPAGTTPSPARRVLDGVVEHASDAIITLDADHRVVVFNRTAARIFGVPASEALGRSIGRFVPDRYRARHRLLMAGFATSAAASHVMGEPRQLVGLRADGSEFPMDASISRTGGGKRQLLTILARDVSELRAAEQAIAARDVAQSQSRAKSALLSRVSHELRTPMNAVLGFAQLMELNPSIDAAGRDHLALIQRAGWGLVATIDDLLKLSGASSGELGVACVATDLAPVAEMALRTCQPQALQKGIALNPLRAPMTRVLGLVDPRRLEQALLNLIANGIKYNRPGGWVQLSVAAAVGEASITVEDGGLGMDEQQLSRLFEPFDRLGRESGPEAGTGLGLVVVRELVHRMGGRMAVASQAGLGTQVRLYFKASTAAD